MSSVPSAAGAEPAASWRDKHDLLQKQFEEYQESSSELERTLEHELAEAEGKGDRAEQRVCEVERERDALRSRKAEAEASLAAARTELESLAEKCEALRAQVRQLESANDELTTKHRISDATTERLNTSLDNELERRALLEGELEDVKRLAEEREQRLLEELRDSRAELASMEQNAQRTSQRPRPPLGRRHTASAACSPARFTRAGWDSGGGRPAPLLATLSPRGPAPKRKSMVAGLPSSSSSGTSRGSTSSSCSSTGDTGGGDSGKGGAVGRTLGTGGATDCSGSVQDEEGSRPADGSGESLQVRCLDDDTMLDAAILNRQALRSASTALPPGYDLQFV